MWPIGLSARLPVVSSVGPSPRRLPDGPRPPSPRRLGFPGAPMRGAPVHPVLAAVSRGCPGAGGRLATCYSPVRHFNRARGRLLRFDLHVLGAPPAFVLSQDQTLRPDGRPERRPPSSFEKKKKSNGFSGAGRADAPPRTIARLLPSIRFSRFPPRPAPPSAQGGTLPPSPPIVKQSKPRTRFSAQLPTKGPRRVPRRGREAAWGRLSAQGYERLPAAPTSSLRAWSG